LSYQLTICIPVKEKPDIVEKFIEHYKNILQHSHVLVFDTLGGEPLRTYASHYEKTNATLAEVRRKGIEMSTSAYILNLDVDTLLPPGYIEQALRILEDPSVGVVAIDYDKLQGHLAFGTSIWKREILLELYSWKDCSEECECIYMWKRVLKKYKIETLPMRAIHLKT
jgi:cellulose synthase/poly-beta-1,6-N-acetylglucosamine synthase-like glycosyltransferase